MSLILAKIESSILPAIYPNWAYVDKFYNTNRPVQEGWSNDIIKTDEKWQVVGSDSYLNRTIQTISYRVWKMDVIAAESARIELLAHAEYVGITLNSNESHHADIIDITSQQIADTELRIYTIRYKDKNVQNYQGAEQPVNNFLSSASVIDRFTYAKYSLRLYCGKTIDSELSLGQSLVISTNLVPKQQPSEAEQKTDKNNGLTYASQTNVIETKRCQFYCTGEEARKIAKYAPMARPAGTGYIIASLLLNSVVQHYTVNPIIPDIQQVEAGVDLWSVVINFPYSQTIVNNFDL